MLFPYLSFSRIARIKPSKFLRQIIQLMLFSLLGMTLIAAGPALAQEAAGEPLAPWQFSHSSKLSWLI